MQEQEVVRQDMEIGRNIQRRTSNETFANDANLRGLFQRKDAEGAEIRAKGAKAAKGKNHKGDGF